MASLPEPYLRAFRKGVPCPSCGAGLLADRAIRAHWWKPVDAPRVSCGQCLGISVLHLRPDHRRNDEVRPQLEIDGAVAARAIARLRAARADDRIAPELSRLREDRVGRRLLRVPEIFEEAKPAFASGTTHTTTTIVFPHPHDQFRPIAERHEMEGSGNDGWRWREPVRWWFRSAPADRRQIAREGWPLKILEVDGVLLVLASQEDYSTTVRATLDLLAPEDLC